MGKRNHTRLLFYPNGASESSKVWKPAHGLCIDGKVYGELSFVSLCVCVFMCVCPMMDWWPFHGLPPTLLQYELAMLLFGFTNLAFV